MARQFAVPVELENPEPANSQTVLAAPVPRLRSTTFGRAALVGGVLLSLFWIGTSVAFVWGWLGFFGLAAQPLSTLALIAAAIILPPFLFLAFAAALARSAAMSEATHMIIAASDRLFSADETAANSAARLARLVRRELDGLNNGLDAAFQRIRTMEMVLEKQIATLDDAGARAQVRGDTIASRLSQESQRIEALGDGLSEAASRVGENVAGRAAQLRSMIESAEGTLKMASQSLDVQAAAFRGAITQAAEAPLEAAKSLEVQAARIEEVADAAMGRAEFVLARQEKHRAQMQELVQRLRDEGEGFDAALSHQRDGMEQLIESLGSEAKKFEVVTGDAERHLEVIMSNAAERASQLTGAFAREAERLKETSEAAASILAGLSAALQDAGAGAQTLIGKAPPRRARMRAIWWARRWRNANACCAPPANSAPRSARSAACWPTPRATWKSISPVCPIWRRKRRAGCARWWRPKPNRCWTCRPAPCPRSMRAPTNPRRSPKPQTPPRPRRKSKPRA